jgi:hypothetical protein
MNSLKYETNWEAGIKRGADVVEILYRQVFKAAKSSGLL